MALRTGQTIHVTGKGHRFAGEAVLVVRCCSECSVLYAIPERLSRDAERDPDVDWYCPNGHGQHIPGKTEEEKLREELEREQNRRANLRARLDQTEAELRGTKAARTRFRNERDVLRQRGGAGVCPHPDCHRHFTNLERHVASKHPELVAELHAGRQA